MRLFRIHLNPRCKEARRDLADPYQMHATLCRAFFPEETRCPPGSLLWRLEPETDREGRPRVLIQSCEIPDWSRIPVPEWLAKDDPGKTPFYFEPNAIQAGQTFRFRLRANPCRTVHGRRQGLMNRDAQMEWLQRKGDRHGYVLAEPKSADYFDFLSQPPGYAYSDCRVTYEQMLRGRQHGGNTIQVFSVLFEGHLSVTDPTGFRSALENGIGHGKVMGLGLLSVAPIAK